MSQLTWCNRLNNDEICAWLKFQLKVYLFRFVHDCINNFLRWLSFIHVCFDLLGRHAYLLYGTKEQAKEVLEKYSEKKLEINGRRIILLKWRQTLPKIVPEGENWYYMFCDSCWLNHFWCPLIVLLKTTKLHENNLQLILCWITKADC